MTRWLTATVACIPLLVSGCGGGVIQSPNEPPPAPSGMTPLRFEVRPKHAIIYVDGTYRGEPSRYKDGWLLVAQGERRLEVRAKNYYSWYGAVKATGVEQRVTVVLVPRPSDDIR